MDLQTIVLCVIGFLVTLVIWLIKDSQRKIEKRIDDYERKNEAEHAKLSEAIVLLRKEFHGALDQHSKEHREALAEQRKEFHGALAQHSKEHREALAEQGKEFHGALAQQGKEFRGALAQHSKEHREALAEQGKELTALRVEVAKLTVPTEREILESLRQLATGSGMQERKLAEGD